MLAQHPPSHASENSGASWFAAIRRGDFAAAWAISDAVLAGRDPAGRDDPALPYHLRWVWDGRPFDGRDVLVRCYHGLGDTLQFARYLAPLRRRVRSLTLEVQPELLPLLAAVPGPDCLIPFRPHDPSPQSECDLEIMELAHALRLEPDAAPYIPFPEPAPPPHAGLRIGLCWSVAGGSWNPARSIPLWRLAPLDAIPGTTVVNLQRGPGTADLQAPRAPRVANPHDTSTDILHTTRLIQGLDLVVSVDTMVAHLGGALGVPLRLLLLAEPDWRWIAGGSGSPWYREVRKYQQPRPGDWATPVQALLADLTGLAEANSLRETSMTQAGS
ncbi:MAG: hypothetical protein NVSMB18_29210 [Acetobacteraceae bacterium]